MAKIRLQKGVIPVVLTIDGHSIDATVTRFDGPQAAAFSQAFRRTQQNRGDMMLLRRKLGEDWSIPDDEIRRRRLLNMTADERAEYERVVQEDEAAALEFLVQTITAHLRLEPGQVQTVDEATNDERDVLTGEDFVAAFGNRRDVLMGAFAAIVAQRARPNAPATTDTPAADDAA